MRLAEVASLSDEPPESGLKTARLAKGLTQKQLAAEMGVARSSVGRWEKGECLPQRAQRVAMAEALGLDLAQVTVLLRLPMPDSRPRRRPGSTSEERPRDADHSARFWDTVERALRLGHVKGPEWVDVATRLARHQRVSDWDG